MKQAALFTAVAAVAIIAVASVSVQAQSSNPLAAMLNSINDLQNAVLNLQQRVTAAEFRIADLENPRPQNRMFLFITNIQGESTDEGHRDWIEVQSFSYGASNPSTTSVGSTGNCGKADFSDFSVVKKLDKASVKLYLACATGEHIPEAKLELCRATGDRQCYMEYKLTDVIVTGVSTGGSTTDDIPTESVSFSYGKIEWKYTMQKGEGNGTTVTGGWDVTNNRPV